jgi:hypothetical protein
MTSSTPGETGAASSGSLAIGGAIHCCPWCCQPLHVSAGDAEIACAACGETVGDGDDILRLVRDPAMRAEADHYQTEADRTVLDAATDLESLRQLYLDNSDAPFNRTVLDGLGDIAGVDVVRLGNGVGVGVKELYLLTRGPRALVHSDLSTNAVRAVCDHFAVGRVRPHRRTPRYRRRLGCAKFRLVAGPEGCIVRRAGAVLAPES